MILLHTAYTRAISNNTVGVSTL